MIEHIARVVYYFGVHLLYASLVWLAAFGLTTVIRASATTKYWIWVATSLNFFIPLGAILDRAFVAHLAGARPLGFIGSFGLTVAENAVIVGAVWLLGVGLMLMRLCLRLRAEYRAAETQGAKNDSRVLISEGVPVEFAGHRPPAVNGVLHSRILLPEGIDRLLSKTEFSAVLLHELTHAKRRDKPDTPDPRNRVVPVMVPSADVDHRFAAGGVPGVLLRRARHPERAWSRPGFSSVETG